LIRIGQPSSALLRQGFEAERTSGTRVGFLFRMAKTRKRTDSASVLENPDRSAGAPPATADPNEPDTRDRRDRVALRAYELYLARGGADGGDFDDWLAAEREIVNGDPSEGDSGE
jgi:hypothetical protein